MQSSGTGLVLLLTATLAACASPNYVNGSSDSEYRAATMSVREVAPRRDIAPANTLQRQTAINVFDETARDGSVDELAALLARAELPDLWTRIRVGFALPDLDDPAVESFAVSFAENRWLERLAPRIRLFLYLLVTEAEKRGLPTELALLPIIESGLNPNAQSPAKASGLCQFIPETGRRFGLVQSHLSDKRRGIGCVESMYAYLAQNYARFGDWFLALAAYNCGEGCVEKAKERNARLNLPLDYVSLKLPRETRGYVPQLLALKRLIETPERFGVHLPELANRPNIDCAVEIPGDMDLTLVARLANIPVMTVKTLNAGVRHELISKALHPQICLPFEAAVRFQVRLSEHSGRLASLTTHTVASSTTLQTLAKRYRTTPEAIRLANDMPPGQQLKPGATVLVPRLETVDRDVPIAVAMHAQLLYEPEIPPLRKIVVRVKAGDSLSRIARRHGLTVKVLRRWNPSLHDLPKAGQVLVLQIPQQNSKVKKS